MDDQRFDRLAKAVAGGATRRQVLRALAGVTGGVIGLTAVQPSSAQSTDRAPKPPNNRGCTAGLTKCRGRCVDLLNDATNCGGCGTVCPPVANATAVCTAGICGIACQPGLTNCGGVCVDTSNDATHCGSCTNVCQGSVCDQIGCFEGTCTQTPVQDCCLDDTYCQIGDFCINGICDPVTHTCAFTYAPAGTHCGFPTNCDGQPTCDGAGTCLPGTPADCEDGNPCTVGICSEFAGCTQVPFDDGTPCGGGRVCAAGICECLSGSCGTSCSVSDECPSTSTCTVGICTGGFCTEATATCTVRLVVVLPSDLPNLPEDAVILERVRPALTESAAFYAAKAGGEMRYVEPVVLHAPENSDYYSTPFGVAAADVPSFYNDTMSAEGVTATAGDYRALDLGKMATYLASVGYGICDESWITLVIFGTTLGGGFAGGNYCGPRLRYTPDSSPYAGVGTAGFAIVSQWSLEVLLTGEPSTNCIAEMGPDAWQCPVNITPGTIIHELGHAFGLGHSCSGWEADNWQIPPEVCGTLIMQAHWTYPNSGFDPREVAILALNPALGG